MNELMKWLHAHPLKACAFTALFTAIPIVLGFRKDWIAPCAAIWIAAWVVWVLTLVVDLKRLAPLLLALAIIIPAHADEPEPAPIGAIAIGTVVIVVGGVCVYKVVKFCQRKFPRSKGTNAPAEFQIAGEGEYGAAFMDSIAGSCEERQLPWTPTVFTLTIEAKTNLVTTMRAERGEEHTQDFWGFEHEQWEHGLSISQPESYSRNRHPVEAEDVPITFNRETGIIKHGKGGLLITVECSKDLREWEPFLKTDVEAGSKLEIADVGRDAAFYRVTARNP